MARNTSVQLLDDLTGEPAEETVRFALDGVQYDIDLVGDNADALRELLEPYVDNGRRTGGRKRAARIIARPKSRRSAKTQSSKQTGKAASSGRGAAKNPAQSSEKKAGTKAASSRSASKKTTASSTRTTGAAKQTTGKSTRAKSGSTSSTTSTKKAASAKTSQARKPSAGSRKVNAVKFSSQ